MAALNRLAHLLRNTKPLIGMLHLPALPGAPAYRGEPVEQITEFALAEASVYVEHGVNALLLENMHDLPYTMEKNIDPATPAAMAVVGRELRRLYPTLTMGLQILAGVNHHALAVAKATGFDFIRAEGFVYGHLADEGWMDACAGSLLRYRRVIGAEDILVLCDVKKKHCAHAISSDLSLEETAASAEFFGADALVVTGAATGSPTRPEDVREAKKGATRLPVFVGSGLTPETVGKFLLADGFIVGSSFKREGNWRNGISTERVSEFVKQLQTLC